MVELQQDKVQVKAAWITLESIYQRNQVHYSMKVGVLRRLLYNVCNCFCFKPYFAKWAAAFNNRLLKVRSAPDPSNINWENLNYSKPNKMIRRLISNIITIILLLLTLMLLVYFTAQKRRIQKEYPPIDCSLEQYSSISEQMVVQEYKSQVNQGYTNCFCQANINSYINYPFPQANN